MYHCGDLYNRRGYSYVGVGLQGKSLYLSFDFSVNSKTTLKKESLERIPSLYNAAPLLSNICN